MKSTRIGILSAAIASICCIGPLLLIILGLGSLGLGAVIGKYHWFFIAAALGLITFAWRSYLKEKKTCSLKGCQMENKRMTLVTLIIATLIVAVFVILNLYTYAIQKNYTNEKSVIKLDKTVTVNIPVEGMVCFTCEIAVSEALKNINGVKSVKVSAKEKAARVNFDADKTDINQLITAINKTGFKASLPK